MSVQVEVVGLEHLRELDEKLHAPLKPVMQRIADQILLPGLQRKLAAVTSPALSKATLDIRRKRDIGGSQPLHATGSLAGSAKSRSTATVAAAGVSFPGGPLQAGFTTGAGSMIPGKVVPARPFAYLDPAEEEAAMDEFENHFLGEE